MMYRLTDNLVLEMVSDENKWRWDITEYDADGDVDHVTEYQTNREGEGLFGWTGAEWKQHLGTSQFSLPRDELAALKALLRHHGLRLTTEEAKERGIKAADIIEA